MGRSLKEHPTVRKNGANGLEFIQVTIRVPPVVHERLRDESSTSGRSMHAEIMQRLVRSLDMELELEAPSSSPSLLQQIADDLRAMRMRMEGQRHEP